MANIKCSRCVAHRAINPQAATRRLGSAHSDRVHIYCDDCAEAWRAWAIGTSRDASCILIDEALPERACRNCTRELPEGVANFCDASCREAAIYDRRYYPPRYSTNPKGYA